MKVRELLLKIIIDIKNQSSYSVEYLSDAKVEKTISEKGTYTKKIICTTATTNL